MGVRKVYNTQLLNPDQVAQGLLQMPDHNVYRRTAGQDPMIPLLAVHCQICGQGLRESHGSLFFFSCRLFEARSVFFQEGVKRL